MNQRTAKTTERKQPASSRLANSYYARLGLQPWASPLEIRRAYRELSKRYHPDTTQLPQAIATSKFQQLNEAYATLSSPERRSLYDLHIGYSRINVIQAPQREADSGQRGSSAYLDPTDRPLSAGEIFMLFILGLTFLGCLLLAIAVALTRGDTLQLPIPASNSLGQTTQLMQPPPLQFFIERL